MRVLIPILVLVCLSVKIYPLCPDTGIVVAELPGLDRLLINPVYFEKNHNDNFIYRCELNSPVCYDSLCRFIRLNIYWDMAGNFFSVDTLPGFPLTKIDHHNFSHEDYQKLNKILLNSSSVLGNKTRDELKDPDQTREADMIDGYSSATNAEIKESVVDGALYTTYTLWHMVNGDIQSRLREFTSNNYCSEIENQLLTSSNYKTVLFALTNWSESDFSSRITEVKMIIKKNIPVVNFYLVKQLPENLTDSIDGEEFLNEIYLLLDENSAGYLKRKYNL